LESKVVVSYASQDEAVIQRFEKFLPDLFIASQVELHSGSETRFKVVKAQGQKCMRCWQIRTDVGSDSNYAQVCGRCASILNEYAVGKA
jgi:isoleucyl-tRNA synthetase